MLLLTFLPTASSILVAAKSAADGARHGLFIVLGIISVDFVFVLIVIFGLRGLIGALQAHAVYLQFIGGGYLIWFGMMLWKSGRRKTGATAAAGAAGMAGATGATGVAGARAGASGGLMKSYRLGIAITAPDQNVLLFYFSVLPAIFDLAAMTLAETALIMLVVAFSLTVSKMTYAYAAVGGSRLFKGTRTQNALPRVAAALIATIGVLLVVRAAYVVAT